MATPRKQCKAVSSKPWLSGTHRKQKTQENIENMQIHVYSQYRTIVIRKSKSRKPRKIAFQGNRSPDFNHPDDSALV